MIHPFEGPALPGPDGRSRGAEDDVASILGLTNLGDSIDSCSPQWYAHGLDDSGNIGFGCVSKGPQPFFPAI